MTHLITRAIGILDPVLVLVVADDRGRIVAGDVQGHHRPCLRDVADGVLPDGEGVVVPLEGVEVADGLVVIAVVADGGIAARDAGNVERLKVLRGVGREDATGVAVAEGDRAIVAIRGTVFEIEVTTRDRQLDDVVVRALGAVELHAERGISDGRGRDESAHDPAHRGRAGRTRGIVVRAAVARGEHRILGVGPHAHEIVDGRIWRMRKAEDVVAELVAGGADAGVAVHDAQELLKAHAAAGDGMVDDDVGLGAGARGVGILEIEHEQYG